MGERRLEVALLDVDDRVEGVTLQVVLQQVEETVLGVVALVVVVHRQAPVQVAIVPDALLDILADEVVVAEKLAVGDKLDEGASIGTVVGLDAAVAGQLAVGEFGATALAVAEGLHLEVAAEGIHGLGTHAVQSHRLLENLAVVFGAGIELRHRLDKFSEGDAATVVADGHAALGEVNLHLYFLAESGSELIDGIINHLLDEHVDAVVVARAVAQFTDVHTRTEPYVLHILEMDDTLVVIVCCRSVQQVFLHGV